MNTHDKISQKHLRRGAYLYIRQSSLYQTEHNQESTQRQYDFKRRALSLGWTADRIQVIDEDLGRSGAEVADRTGFQRLTADVGLGKVGIVLSLEISRLARNCSDWHRLLEICALSETLIMDEDGLYDPNNFNDQLVLGLRGTMSEAELHFLKARLEGGKLNKARRGELKLRLSTGFIYDTEDKVILDPDLQVRQAIQLVFQVFKREKSAWQTVVKLAETRAQIPIRMSQRPTPGELRWTKPTLSQILRILQNPTFAGAYFYGRTRYRKGVGSRKRPMDEWEVLIPNAHPGYITWEQYQENLAILSNNNRDRRNPADRAPSREGPALLQGVILCGVCGKRMTVRYHRRRRSLFPDYVCQNVAKEFGGKICQSIPGRGVDLAVGEVVAQSVTPESINVALEVFEELRRRDEEIESLHRSQIERARHEGNMAERQFLLANPENRLVVDTLESRWNEKLLALAAVEQSRSEWREKRTTALNTEVREQILKLAEDFPTVWNHPKTSPRERKRMLRLLIEDVTLTRGQDIRVQIRWKGGATQELHLPLPLNAADAKRMPPDLLEDIAELAKNHTDEEIAGILNRQGRKSGTGLQFTWQNVGRIRRDKNIPSYEHHLRQAGMVTSDVIMQEYGITWNTLKRWRLEGGIRGIRCNRKQWFFEDPASKTPPVPTACAPGGAQKKSLREESAGGGAV